MATDARNKIGAAGNVAGAARPLLSYRDYLYGGGDNEFDIGSGQNDAPATVQAIGDARHPVRPVLKYRDYLYGGETNDIVVPPVTKGARST